MELEKRKRLIVREGQEQEKDRLKKLKEEESGAGGSRSGAAADAAAEEATVVATEDEVEQFFAILRRMKEAVKYFDEKGRGRKEWREALEQAEDAVDDDGEGAGVKNNEEEVMNEGLDLNAAAPEAAENGGA